MLIHLIAAARPNFMKIAPLYHALKREQWADPVIVHTGQHYDLNMSDAFFQDLNLPEPHIHLGVGSGTHAEQTAKVMTAYEQVLTETRPDVVVVVGDVNSTMACTLAASKVVYPQAQSSKLKAESNEFVHGSLPQGQRLSNEVPIKRKGVDSFELSAMSYELGRRPLVAHLEAGLRSFDRTMPEEINRLVTDSLADILWTPSPDGNENLEREGVPEHKVVRVGNIMIDSLEMLREKIEAQAAFSEFGLEPKQYGLVTLHRPGNVDNPEILKSLCELLCRVADRAPLLFPVHPRTRKSLEQNGLMKIIERQPKILLTEPLGYIRFMNLVFNCRLAITDSGGIQEETSYLGIPCLTLRENTERPITITQGTNQLCGLHDLEAKVAQVLNDPPPAPKKIELWDGKTAERIVNLLRKMI
jgi:UDP-N-acetylglucosamine 2-epimerase (non-hydrolysing)